MKKITSVAALLCSTLISMPTFAGYVYMGPGLFVQDNTTQTSSSYRGIHPRMTLGYATMVQDMNLAAEIFAIPFSATLSDNYATGGQSAKSTRSIGLSILPGIMLNDSVLAYFRFGAVNTNFSGPNVSRSGMMFGLGLELPFSPCWNVRGEYIYTTYISAPTIGSVKSDQTGITAIYKFLN